MKIPLQNVSIDYSDLLPNVTLTLKRLNINLLNEEVEVHYSHSIPTNSPLSGPSEIHLNDGVITMSLPQEFKDVFGAMMNNHIAMNYGYINPPTPEPVTP